MAVLALAGLVACGSASGGASRQRPRGGLAGATADAGAGAAANTHQGFVSAGHVLKSDHFQMVSTLGPPSVTAGSSVSKRARLRSGLVPNVTE